MSAVISVVTQFIGMPDLSAISAELLGPSAKIVKTST